MTERWETVEEINAARERFEAALGWKRPAVWGLVTRDGDVLRANVETGYLPGVLVATVLGHTGGTAALPLTVADAEAAIALGVPAEACTDIPHPNIAALRGLVADGADAIAVFVDEADLEARFGEGQPHLRALMDEVRRASGAS